jgi:2'-5' RNA ligase
VILGRRVLVAPIDGALGARIQAWRMIHDPRYAAVMPPHLTLCYQPPAAPVALIEAQVRHALPEPVPIRLGRFGELGNRDCTLCLAVLDTAALDAARARLFDGTYVQFEGYRAWRWHVTCVRNGRLRDRAALLADAALALAVEDEAWTLERVSLLERSPTRYEPIAEWPLAQTADASG